MTYIAGKHFWVFFTILIFFWPKIVFSADPPNLTSPTDNSITQKSPKLTWEYRGECIETGSCFLVEVDNSADVSSPEKTTYTNNFSYSPQNLAEGTWYWRVKAKDKQSLQWSSWSQVFKFNVSSQTSTPSPSQTNNPPPTSSPSSTAQPSLTTSSSSKSENLFSIKDIPTEINSNQEFEISVSLKLPNNPNQNFYLKGAFKKEGSSNYFGQTQVGNDWIKNNEKYSRQLKIQADTSGGWEGKIKIRPDPEDSGFDGTGNYLLKVGRYSDSGSGPTWSNELNLKINAVEKPESSLTPQASEDMTEENEPEEIDLTASLVKSSPKVYEIKIASVAGISTISDNTNLESETKVLEEKKINWLLITLGLGILISGGGFTFYKFKKERINAIHTN